MNREGYRDDVAYAALNKVASLHSLEIVGLRDKKTGKEYRK